MSTGPAVLNGKLRYVSPSQIERFDSSCDGGCERKWYYKYVLGYKERTSKAAQLGTQVHSQIEHYLKTREHVLGPIALSGFRFLPLPLLDGPGLFVETEIGKPFELLPGGIHGPVESALIIAETPVIARIDIIDVRSVHIVEGEEGEAKEITETGVVEVNDWKTTSSIDNYAKTPDELAATHQMILYAEYVRRTYNPERIRLSHTVFQTRGFREASKRSKVLSADQVKKACRRSESVVEWMRSVAGMRRIEDVPANYDACDAYGGCQFRKECPRDDLVTISNLKARLDSVQLSKEKGTKNMSLIDEMNKRPMKQPIDLSTIPAVSEISEPRETVADAKAALLAEEHAIITPPDLPEPSAVAAVPKLGPMEGCQSEKQVRLESKNTKFVCPCGLVVKIKPLKLEDGQYYAYVPKHEKPRIADHLLVGATVGDQVYVLPFKESGLVLLLDCIEDKASTHRLETYAVELADRLAVEMNGGHDIRCASGDSPLAFGRWKGMLAALMKTQPPMPGHYAVSSASEFGMVAFEALISLATRVVRGVR